MFGISFNELLIVLALALIILGPDKLPELARTLGKGLGELKRATDDVTRTIMVDTGLKETADSLKESMKIDPGISRQELTKTFEDIEKGVKPEVLAKPASADQDENPEDEGEASESDAASQPESAQSEPGQPKPAQTTKKPAAKFADDDSE